MITTCTECQARYQLDDEKIPRRKIRVRCPACSGVFSLDGALAASARVEPMPTVEPVTETQAFAEDDMVLTSGFDTSFSPEPEIETEPLAPIVAQQAAQVSPQNSSPASSQTMTDPVQSSVAVLDQAAASSGTARRRRSKEEMLARALVSDILVYNREQRDNALAAGNLLEALGGEIKKSWELYKEKVTPDVANSTNHFRDALNEILAEGDKVF